MLFSSLSWLLLSPLLFIDLFFFKLFKYLAPLLTVRFPPHIGSAGLFCPQNAAEICSSPNQMAAFTERSITPVPHHMTFASLGASAAQGPPSSSSMPRRGLRVWVAPPVWQAKFFKEGGKKNPRFLYLDAETRVSSERFRGADLERTQSLLAEQLRGIGWSRAGPFFLVQIYSLWNSAGLVTWGRVTGRRPKMDRRNRDEAVQAAHSHFYKFEETARTPGVISYSEKCFHVQILQCFFCCFFLNFKTSFQIWGSWYLEIVEWFGSQQIVHKMICFN